MTPFSDSSPRLLKYITEPFENNTGKEGYEGKEGGLVLKTIEV
jgi:hypothetical protein